MDDKNKILIISYNYPPYNTPGVFRIIGFVNHFEDNGFIPYILTVLNPQDLDYDEELWNFVYGPAQVWKTRSLELFNWMLQRAARLAKPFIKKQPKSDGRNESHPKGRHGLRSIFGSLNQWVNFPDRAIWWVPTAVIAAWKLTRKQGINYFLTSSPPHSSQLIGLFLKILRPNLTWIGDYRDPWTDNLHIKNLRSKRLESMEAWIEKRILQKTDLVIANTDANKDRLLSRFSFLKPDRVIVITNGYDLRDLDKVKESKSSLHPDRKIFTFIGSLYPGMIDSLVEACSALKTEDPIIDRKLQFLFVGYFDDEDKEIVTRMGLDDLFSFIGIVSYKKSLEFMVAADVLLCLLPPDMAYCIPSKVYNYIAARKPILAIIPDGCAADIFHELKIGVVIAPGAKEAIQKVLKEAAENGLPLIKPLFNSSLFEKYEKKNLIAKLAYKITMVKS